MPYSGIPNLQKGWEVVKASGCENAMLILDTWHWVRANQPYDILTPEIAEKVISIQINDAYERPYADSILRDESMHDRLAPGTGAKDTAGFVKMIKDADIFMEASKGGTWARKGITDEVLWEINPKLVIVHVSGFGQEGDPKDGKACCL